MEDKIRLKDLHWSLKTAIIVVWVWIAVLALSFLAGFLGGLLALI